MNGSFSVWVVDLSRRSTYPQYIPIEQFYKLCVMRLLPNILGKDHLGSLAREVVEHVELYQLWLECLEDYMMNGTN